MDSVNKVKLPTADGSENLAFPLSCGLHGGLPNGCKIPIVACSEFFLQLFAPVSPKPRGPNTHKRAAPAIIAPVVEVL